jgi:hypothetical protein
MRPSRWPLIMTRVAPLPCSALRGSSVAPDVLSLLFSHLANTSTRADFPFMLPELQRVIAEYAQPERRFMGVTVDESQPDGWRIERMDGNELRERLQCSRAYKRSSDSSSINDTEKEEQQLARWHCRSSTKNKWRRCSRARWTIC